VAGGGNRATGARSVVVGGGYNLASGQWSFIGGGGRQTNNAGGAGTFIEDHVAAGDFSTIGGGQGNRAGTAANPAGTAFAALGGGVNNAASDAHTTVAGGQRNAASGFTSTIGGGGFNTASGTHRAVGGGFGNFASGQSITVAGGENNTATGDFSAIPGGSGNVASGNFSVAMGHHAFTQTSDAGGMIVVIHSGAFVFSDDSSGKFHSTASNSFNVLATGGVRIVTGATNTAGEATPSAGVTIGPGGGSWTTLSDRNAKDGLTAIDPRNVLAKVGAMPGYTWRYKTEVSRALHMGPTAQDFRAAFGLGDNDKTITTVDEGGVALAAIQGLNAKVEEQASTIGGQQREIAELRRMPLELRSTMEVKAAMH